MMILDLARVNQQHPTKEEGTMKDGWMITG
jgi:hypothetical protein